MIIVKLNLITGLVDKGIPRPVQYYFNQEMFDLYLSLEKDGLMCPISAGKYLTTDGLIKYRVLDGVRRLICARLLGWEAA